MKILKFQAENFQRLKVVDITPIGTTIKLTGPNAQGKSSVLDAIMAALGGNRTLPEQPIHRGATNAHIRLELDEWIVTRTFTDKGSYLKVESKEGAAFKSPQALLDKVVGQLAFDPLKFAQADAKSQRAWLLQAVGFTVDVAQLEQLAERAVTGPTAWETLQATRKAVFEARTNVNRRKDQMAKTLQQLPVVDPIEPVQLADLLAEQAQLQTAEAKQQEWRQKLIQEQSRVNQLQIEIGDLENDIALLEAQLAAKKEALQSAQTMATSFTKVVQALPPIDLTDLHQRMATADQRNQQAAQYQQRQALQQQVDAIVAEADALTDQLAALDQYQQQQLASATLPIDGLTLVDDQVYYQGIPFSQASQAEQWQVSTAIAMALNPTLRVMRIENAAVLDTAHLAWLEQVAADQDYQIWVELVSDSSDGVGIYIEDGQVAAVDGQRIGEAIES